MGFYVLNIGLCFELARRTLTAVRASSFYVLNIGLRFEHVKLLKANGFARIVSMS